MNQIHTGLPRIFSKEEKGTDMFTIRPYEQSDYPSIMAYDLPQEQAIYTSLPVDVIEASQNNLGYKPYVVFDQGHLIGCFALFTPSTGNPYTPKRLFSNHCRSIPAIKRRAMLCEYSMAWLTSRESITRGEMKSC